MESMTFYEMIGFQAPDLGDTLTEIPKPDLSRSALFFDFDGTLVDIAETPDSVSITPGLPEILNDLMLATNGAVALVSGRSVKRLQTFLPGFGGRIVGSHGAERFHDGTLTQHDLAGSDAVQQISDMTTQYAETVDGLVAETKPTGVTLHYRKAPEAHAQVLKFMQALEVCWPDFEMHPTKMAYELRPKGVDKEQAIADLMAAAPFEGRTPVFFADDMTDEPALAKIAADGGLSIKVGDGDTVAEYRVASPAAVIETLRSWL